MLRVEVPATTTNFGSGFDAFGLALSMRNTFILTPSETYSVKVEGYSEGIPRDEGNLFIRVYKRVCEYVGKEERIELHQINRIPPARGLGSSASAIAGAIEGALALLGVSLPLEEKLRIAFEFESHPDNLLPAFVGGFTVCATTEGNLTFKKLKFPNELLLVFVVPPYEVKTSDARRVLPRAVPLTDAVFNLQRSALLVTSLLTGDYSLLREAVEDRLHQPYRRKLVPEFEALKERAYEHGALAFFLSGAGPAMCAITDKEPERLSLSLGEAFRELSGRSAEVLVLKPEQEGVRVSRSPA
ncbi:MAG: homoserine kinase [Aquificae bacterium]|nr:homoserine kinase [Aquificota bacterium]